MIAFHQKGNFSKTSSMFQRMLESVDLSLLDKYGREGIALLSAATPIDSGITANSWYYTIEHEKGVARLIFGNSNVQDGYSIALLIQYGHATRTGGWVEGRDYLNPTLQPLFDKMAEELWKGVTKK